MMRLQHHCFSDKFVANKYVDNKFVGMYAGSMERRELKRAIGTWVVGDRFWDRQAEMDLFLERIREGAHLLLTAPRRIGKTSLLKEAARLLGDDYISVYIDLQKAENAADAIVELSLAAHEYKSVWERAGAVFGAAIANSLESVQVKGLGITLRSSLTEDNWRAKGEQFLQILAEQDKPVALFMDEVAILVNRMLRGDDYRMTPDRRATVDAFLSWIRASSIRHQGKIRFVLTGSIGLEPLVRQAGLSATLNTFTPFSVGPWSREAAAGCLEALARAYQIALPPDVIENMLDRLGVCIPHHVQMFFDHVYQAARLASLSAVDEPLVERVYQQSMLGIRGHVELSHMEERLRAVLGPELDILALDLLTEAAVAGRLTPDAALFLAKADDGSEALEKLREVLAVLEHDGYLVGRAGGHVFDSRLLRDWWAARFKLGYIPVAQRRSPNA